MVDGNGERTGEPGEPGLAGGAGAGGAEGAQPPTTAPSRQSVAAQGPDVQRLGRWAAVGVTVAIVAIVAVMILSAMR